MGHAVDVDAARGDVGGDQHAGAARAEIRRARACAGSGSCCRGWRRRRRRRASRCCATRSAPRLVRVKTMARESPSSCISSTSMSRLARAVDEEHMLVDALGGGRDRRDRHLRRIVQHVGGEAGDLLRHGRREEQVLPLLRQLRDDLADRNDEAEIEHVVGFVEDDDFGRRELQACRWRYGRAGGRASRRARRGRAPACRSAGRCETPPTMTPTELRPHELAIGAEAVGDLRGEFARRRQHERARVLGAGRRRSATRRSRIGSAKAAVLPVPVWAMPSRSRPCSSDGNGLGLDGGRGLVAFVLESAQATISARPRSENLVTERLSKWNLRRGPRKRASGRSGKMGDLPRVSGRHWVRKGRSTARRRAKGPVRSTRLERLMLRRSVLLL